MPFVFVTPYPRTRHPVWPRGVPARVTSSGGTKYRIKKTTLVLIYHASWIFKRLQRLIDRTAPSSTASLCLCLVFWAYRPIILSASNPHYPLQSKLDQITYSRTANHFDGT